MKTIVHVTRTYFPINGGYSVRVANLITRLDKEKYKIIQFTSPRQTNYGILKNGSWENSDGIITYHSYKPERYNKKLLFGVRTLRRYSDIYYLYKYILNKIKSDNINPDIIHGHNDGLVGLAAFFVAMKLGKPFIYDVHAFSFDEKNSFNGVKRFIFDSIEKKFQKYLINKANYVVCISKSQKVYIQNIFKNYQQKFIIYYNGVDKNVFKPLDNIASERNILAVNASKEGEGADKVFKNIDLIINDFANVKLVTFLGHCKELSPILKQNFDKIKNKKNILIVENLNQVELNKYYNKILIYIMLRDKTIQNETIVPLKPFEILASGCLLLVSSVQGLTEIIKDEYNGFVLNEGENLVDKVNYILTLSDSRLKSIRDNGIRTASRFTLDNNIKVIEDLYEKIN